jgi:hypothetical protein
VLRKGLRFKAVRSCSGPIFPTGRIRAKIPTTIRGC